MFRIINDLADVSASYATLYCDLWGCLHNGREPFPAAVAALQQFRAGGGTVILVTNSPRPRPAVARQLESIGVPSDCYDDIASSGDAAQASMARGDFGRNVYHLGPERDLVFFQNEDGSAIEVTRVPLDQAEGIICTGLFDDMTETPEDYRLTIRTGVNRGLKLLCANPDVIVDVGETRIYCAGAIAEAYTAAGGESFYFGKPHVPIYQLARKRLEAIRGPVEQNRILCVGDGINTDIRGGIGENLDTLFIAGGLAAEQTGMKAGEPDPDRLAAFLQDAQMSPTATIGHLR